MIALIEHVLRDKNRYVKAISTWNSDLLPVQCKMARTALGMSVKELAEVAHVSTNTLVRFERGDELKARTVSAIRTALEGAGVVFIQGDYSGPGGPGVRLKDGVVVHNPNTMSPE